MAYPAFHSEKKTPSAQWQRFATELVAKAGVLDQETADILLDAFARVPRDLFVLDKYALSADQDISLPIGFGQCTGRPSVVARMLALVGARKGMKLLEIGSGSGYLSAVMTAAGVRVFSVESVGFLAQRTRKLLDSLYFQNVIIHRGDGRRGWSEHAPYDAIIVSTPMAQIEPELLAQLMSPGGRLVAPVGGADEQVLTLWEAQEDGTVRYQLESCHFNSDK